MSDQPCNHNLESRFLTGEDRDPDIEGPQLLIECVDCKYRFSLQELIEMHPELMQPTIEGPYEFN